MGWDRAGVVELEHGVLCCSGDGADGRVGEEEGGEVSEGFWGEVSEKAVQHVAWDLVGMDEAGELTMVGLRLVTERLGRKELYIEFRIYLWVVLRG